MRMRRKPWARPELAACDYYIENPKGQFGAWRKLFKNSNLPLQIELGCGKGVFTAELAYRNRAVNYVAMDIKSDVLGSARRNISSLFDASNEKPENILLTVFNAEQVDEVFSKEDGIERIYINFCNPWPKKKHKKRRLTYPRLLEKYKTFLKKGGEIHFKTDDDELFSDSLEYFKESGFALFDVTYDLHNSDVKDNIMTEHEKMFSSQGIKIKYLTARYI